MKNKKGFISFFMIKWVLIAVVVLIALGLMIWFGMKISDGLVAIGTFLTKWFIWILVGIVLIIYKQPIIMVLKSIFK